MLPSQRLEIRQPMRQQLQMIEETQWLKVMLGEIERKRQELQEAEQEAERRGDQPSGGRPTNPA